MFNNLGSRTVSFPSKARKQKIINFRNNHKIAPAHDKTYNKACATSEDLDQPAHPCSLIRVFEDRMCLLQPLGYPKRDKRDPLPI